MHKNVTAIVPAYNEAENITKTIAGLKKISEINQIIVVDDGSKDNTFDKINKLDGILVLRNDNNMGKGHAIKKALQYASNKYVALVDADLCESAFEIRLLIEKIIPEDNAMIIGLLPAPLKKGGFGIVKYTSRKGFYILTSREINSLLSGQRIMPLDFLRSVEIPDNFGLEFKLSLEAVRNKLNIIEVPVSIHHRETGRDIKGFVHRGKQLIDILHTIIKEVR